MSEKYIKSRLLLFHRLRNLDFAVHCRHTIYNPFMTFALRRLSDLHDATVRVYGF